MGPLELGYLTFRFVASNSVAFLDFSNELITLPFDNLPVIVSQSVRLLLCLASQLLLVAFDLLGLHYRPQLG